MDTDHSGLSKFGGPDDENYLLLLPEIQRMVKDAPSAIASRQGATGPTGPTTQQDQANQKRHWIVPFGRNRQFVGRGSILEELFAIIPPSVDKDNCQRTAIEGLGGVGKTQIALEAAFQVRDMHPDCDIFWVPAVGVTNFENAYRKIGQELGIKGIDDDKADIKSLVREALNCESAGSWLLIIDNADDIELFTGNASISTYLPSSYNGSILFTTRDHRATVELSATPITVGKLERGESQKLLETSSKRAQLRNPEDTTKLLDFLEDLPLAIKQASTYMAKEGISTTEYLEFCQSSEADAMNLLSEDFRDLYRYNEIPNPVVKTFRISFEKISKRDPLAADYLRFISFLSDKDIPRSLLPPAEKFEATKAIGTLKGYAFITEQEEGDIYDIHRLARLSMLNWLTTTGDRQQWATKVSQQLANVFPWPLSSNKTVWMRYIPHAQNFTKFLADTNDAKAEATLLRMLGIAFEYLGRYEEAEDLFKKVLGLVGEVRGEAVADKLAITSDLARVLYLQDRYEAAERMLEEMLSLRQATHEKSFYTVMEMRLLAEALTKQHKFEESESMEWQTLKLVKEILGKRHPGNNELDTRTANVDNNKALMFYEEAESLYQQAQEKNSSLKDQILFLMTEFTSRIQTQGKYEEAEQMLRRLLPLMRTSLGDDDISTIDTMVMLGQTLCSQEKSKSEEAVEILRQALALRQELQGGSHPSTLFTMQSLGVALCHVGNPKEAVTILRQTLLQQQKVQGEAHVDTLLTMHFLGIALYEEGSSKEAVKILRQTLVLDQKVRGETHPSTLNTMRRLGIALYYEGNSKEAVNILLQARDLHQETRHPDRGMIQEWIDFILRNINPDAKD